MQLFRTCYRLPFLCGFLLLLISLFFPSNAKCQTVTLNGDIESLENVMNNISAQTGYRFFYRVEQLKKALPVKVIVKHEDMRVALNKIFDRQPFSYSVANKTIVLHDKVPIITKKHTDTTVHSQRIQVNGHVSDSSGNPLQSVSILIMHKSDFESVTYSVTNSKGDFQVDAEKGDVVRFSYIGYIGQKVILSDNAEINIVLLAQPKILDSLAISSVNTGYQKIKPEQSTGAIAQINTKEYESRINTNFLDGLVNKLPGLMINNNVQFNSNVNGQKTSNNLFNIRGISTMSANQNPLIVIDGYPTELTMDMIDPNEIKSVTILKDAAASTVYGVRASNGVIVIERKQASVGKPRIAFRATAGFTPKENFNRYRWDKNGSEIFTSYQKSSYRLNSSSWDQAWTNSNNSAFSPVYFILAQQAANAITPYQAEQAFNALNQYNNANDYSRLFLHTASTQTYNMDISGGNANALYYITANYTGNKYEQIKNSDHKFLLSGRSTLKFSQRLSLELTTDYMESVKKSSPLIDIGSVFPYEHFTDQLGNPLPITSGSGINPYFNKSIMALGLEDNLYYPIVDVNEINDKTHTINNRFTANFDYNFGNGFDLMFGGIYETSNTDIRHFASALSSEARQYVNSYVTSNTDGTLNFNIPKGGFLKQESDNTSSYTARMQLNYNKRIGSLHSINGIVGAEVRNLTQKSNLASYFGYDDKTLLQQPVNYSDIFNGIINGNYSMTRSLNSSGYQGLYNEYFNQAYTQDRYVSGYANIVYAYKNTYSLTGSMRIDQSNLFGTNPKYKYKPLWSIGAAWNINKESFMQNVTWLTLLKLRVAEGFNGNVAKMSLPEVIARTQLNQYTSPNTPSLVLSSYANSSLRWEQTNNFNIGLDYRILKNINGTIDLYRKKSTDIMSGSQIDPTIGESPTLINNATINNKGIEVSLHADWITTNSFNWNTGFVFARNTSKVLKVYQNIAYAPQTLNSMGYVEGYPTGAIFAYRYAGLDSMGYPMIKSGNNKLYHTEDNSFGSQIGDVMTHDTSDVFKYMGSSIPTMNLGLSNRFDIGSFYLYLMVNYYGGFKVIVPRNDPSSLRPLDGAGYYWKQPGDETKVDGMALVAYGNAYAKYAYNYSDNQVVNGDYITLADVTASYSLDKSRFIKKIGFSHFEIKLQASNLWTVGLNKYNYSAATNSFAKPYITPTYTIGVFTNF